MKKVHHVTAHKESKVKLVNFYFWKEIQKFRKKQNHS